MSPLLTLLYDAVEQPWLLILAIVLPLVLVFLLRRARARRTKRLARLGTFDTIRRLVPGDREVEVCR